MSMRRHHVASTLVRRHFYVMCPLGTEDYIIQFFTGQRSHEQARVTFIGPLHYLQFKHQWVL